MWQQCSRLKDLYYDKYFCFSCRAMPALEHAAPAVTSQPAKLGPSPRSMGVMTNMIGKHALHAFDTGSNLDSCPWLGGICRRQANRADSQS